MTTAPEMLNRAAEIMAEREKKEITQDILKEFYLYSSETGNFVFKKTRGGITAGNIAGTLLKSGDINYIRISIFGKQYLAHRLAWLYSHGKFPDGEIDHIDGNSLNNRIENLREATRKQNNENTKLRSNNKSGFRGVSFNKNSKKWRATIQHNKKPIHIGYFKTKEDAANAVIVERKNLFTHYTNREV